MKTIYQGSKVKLVNKFGWHRVVKIIDYEFIRIKDDPNPVARINVTSVSNRDIERSCRQEKCVCHGGDLDYHVLAGIF